MPIVQINQEFFNNDAQANFDSRTHIDMGIDIKGLINRNNYLIEGIRGTGKTHILKMIRQEVVEKFTQYRVLPIYVSLAKYSEYESLTSDEFRIHLYTSIVENAITTIKDNKEVFKQGNPQIIKAFKEGLPIFPFFFNQSFDEIIESIDILVKELNEGLFTGNIKMNSKDKVDGNSSVDMNPIKFGGTYSKEKQVEYVIDQLSHKNASKYILSFFKKLVNILQLDYCLLLVDEISGVSKEKQIEVFRLLKLIRSCNEGQKDTNIMYFIGGVYPPSSTNYPSLVKGNEFEFKTGDDCTMKFLEIDILNEEYEEFFKYVTSKRLEKYHLKESNGDILWMFESEKAFLLAAFAANGLPRRYFQILDIAYSNAKSKFMQESTIKRIDIPSISSAIQHIAENEILDENHLTEQDFEYLEEIIIPKLTTRNSTVETKNANNNSETLIHLFIKVSTNDRNRLGNLIYRGVIHNLNRTRKSKYSKSSESNPIGKMLMIDIAVSYYHRLYNVQNCVEYVQKDLRENVKRGFQYFSEIKLNK